MTHRCLILLLLCTGFLHGREDPTKDGPKRKAEKLLTSFRAEARGQAAKVEQGTLSKTRLLEEVNQLFLKIRDHDDMAKFFTAKKPSVEEKCQALFQWMLQRKPTAEEKKNAMTHLRGSKNIKQGFLEVVWAITFSQEFLSGQQK